MPKERGVDGRMKLEPYWHRHLAPVSCSDIHKVILVRQKIDIDDKWL